MVETQTSPQAGEGQPVHLQRTLQAVKLGLICYVIAGGLTSLLGWVLDIRRLTDWDDNGVSIQPNSCIAALSAGVALYLLDRGAIRAARAWALFVAFIGASVIFQIVTRLNLGIDALLLFGREWGNKGVLSPGRMGPPGALSWTLIGTAIFLATRFESARGRKIAPILGLVTATIASLSLIGILYGADRLYMVPTLTIIAVQTSSFIFAASIAIVMSVPDRGPMLIIREEQSAGIVARRMVPALIAIPILLGFLRLTGQRAGLFDAPFGTALRTLSEIILFLMLLWWASSAINRHARDRSESDAALSKSREQLEAELRDTMLLQSVSGELVSEKNNEAVYERILDAAVSIMRSEFASMQTYHPERGASGELYLIACRGFTEEAKKTWQWVAPSKTTTCGMALLTAKRCIVSDTFQCTWMAGTPTLETYTNTGIRAVQSTPLYSRGGKVVGMISTHWRNPHTPSERDLRLFDILARQLADLIERTDRETAREQALESERAARTQAEHAARVKDEFLATLSHELRTPLNAILGWSQILSKDANDPEQVRYAAEVIERNSRLQAQLVTDLLDMSRIVSGKMRLEVARVDLPTIVDAAIESVHLAAEAKGVRVHRAAGARPAAVNGDPARLQQVVWNLLSNAVKFTPRGGSVTVQIQPNEHLVEIQVRDTGEGIAPEFIAHVFERFRQFDASASRSHGGLGIGLALVKQLVELHGGRVRAQSDGLGLGSTFVIELPLAASADDGQHERRMTIQPVARRLAPWAPAKLNGIRVLVVDDEADALAMVCRVLEESNAIVATALSSNAALEVLAREPFDVIVSDIGMPGFDGYSLIAEIRTRGIATPAIALTAFARAEDQSKAMFAGYQAHLAKPVEISKLLASISTLANVRNPMPEEFA